MFISDDDRAFLSRLARLPEPTIQALCEATGVTATAVRHRLSRLMDVGCVEKHSEIRGRGRPANYYRLTSAGRNQLGDNSTRLAELLWREVMRIDSHAIREQIIDGVRAGLAEDLSVGIEGTTPRERLEQLGSRMKSTGFDVAVSTTEQGTVLQEHCCPYHSVADGQSAHEICRFEEEVFSSVVGAPVRISSHCSDGSGCCEFELVELGGYAESKSASESVSGNAASGESERDAGSQEVTS